ncbi:hypothetical protein GCM10008940_07400 [Microbulbifer agarilyticus]
MEPLIPDGSYCLFRPVPAGTRQNRKLLVHHVGVADEESGGAYTVKVYSSEKVSSDEGDGWLHSQIIMRPLNPEYEPIVLQPESEGEVVAIAEFVRVLN